MRNLLWKDFWQNSRVLLAVGIIVAMPYGIVFAFGIGDTIVNRSWTAASCFEPGEWAEGMRSASAFSLGLCILLAAFVGGNAIAGERADRSAEFAAGLPIPRGQAVTSKVVLATIPCLAMWAINAVAWVAAWRLGVYAKDPTFGRSADDLVPLPLCLAAIVAMFGLGWLYSSLLRNPAIATLAAIGTAVGILVAVRVGDLAIRGDTKPPVDLWVAFYVAVLLLGLLSVAGGAVIYRHRIES